MEIWKFLNELIPEGGDYFVSNLGRICSKKNGNSKILKPIIANGYYRVGLSNKGKVKYYFVHQLVALAFLDNPNNLPCVNHKDENKLNNSSDNLEYCTHQYNLTYNNIRNKAIETRKKNNKLNEKAVLQLDKTTKDVINEFVSASEASRITGISKAHICKVANLKPNYNTAGGFVWRWKDKI